MYSLFSTHVFPYADIETIQISWRRTGEAIYGTTGVLANEPTVLKGEHL